MPSLFKVLGGAQRRQTRVCVFLVAFRISVGFSIHEIQNRDSYLEFPGESLTDLGPTLI